MTVPEITERLGLAREAQGRNWYVQASNASANQGLYEGMEWMSKNAKAAQ